MAEARQPSHDLYLDKTFKKTFKYLYLDKYPYLYKTFKKTFQSGISRFNKTSKTFKKTFKKTSKYFYLQVRHLPVPPRRRARALAFHAQHLPTRG